MRPSAFVVVAVTFTAVAGAQARSNAPPRLPPPPVPVQPIGAWTPVPERSEEHTSELQSPYDLVCRLLLEKKKKNKKKPLYTTKKIKQKQQHERTTLH